VSKRLRGYGQRKTGDLKMTDRLSHSDRSLNMSKIKGKDTKIELAVRKELFKNGLRYRLNSKLKGKPDLIFPSAKIALFVNGCFWHQHGCKLSYKPKTNIDFWNKKLLENKKRDSEVKKFLKRSGWEPLYIWECEIDKDLQSVVLKVIDIVKKNKRNIH